MCIHSPGQLQNAAAVRKFMQISSAAEMSDRSGRGGGGSRGGSRGGSGRGSL